MWLIGPLSFSSLFFSCFFFLLWEGKGGQVISSAAWGSWIFWKSKYELRDGVIAIWSTVFSTNCHINISRTQKENALKLLALVLLWGKRRQKWGICRHFAHGTLSKLQSQHFKCHLCTNSSWNTTHPIQKIHSKDCRIVFLSVVRANHKMATVSLLRPTGSNNSAYTMKQNWAGLVSEGCDIFPRPIVVPSPALLLSSIDGFIKRFPCLFKLFIHHQ